LTLRTSRQDEKVVVEITDNGPGIPPEIKERIFEAFFTTKPPGIGSGLGLHISYNIIEEHRGRIQVDSKPGATTFRVTLPIQLKRGEA
jgi:signal transduction histidine kinase